MIYRAYRVPYDWVPQLPKPEEIAIAPIDVNDFRVPGAAPRGGARVTEVPGTTGYDKIDGYCVQIEEAPPVDAVIEDDDDDLNGEIRF